MSDHGPDLLFGTHLLPPPERARDVLEPAGRTEQVIRRFAAEVAPAVRELVAAERA